MNFERKKNKCQILASGKNKKINTKLISTYLQNQNQKVKTRQKKSNKFLVLRFQYREQQQKQGQKPNNTKTTTILLNSQAHNESLNFKTLRQSPKSKNPKKCNKYSKFFNLKYINVCVNQQKRAFRII